MFQGLLAPVGTNYKRIEIACQQVLKENASVFSEQWIILPGEYAGRLTPDFIMGSYFSYLKRVTLFLAWPVTTEHGVEFRFMATKFHLLTFAAPLYADEDGVNSVTLRICGGPFVQGDQCNRGKFSFCREEVPDGIRVSVRLSGYYPRLLGSRAPGRFRKYLYRFTQAFIHKLVTTRFLAFLYRDLTGARPRFCIAALHEEAGEDI
jgi:hypothetical protein